MVMSTAGSLATNGDAAAGAGQRFKFYGTLYPYQQELSERASTGNTIIHLPTGAGKTVVAAHIAARRMSQGLVVMLVTRVPLVTQQQMVLERHIIGARIARIAGQTKDAKSWTELCEKFDGVVMIDSIFYSWVTTNPKIFDDIGILIFDEVHNARKNSFFAKIARFVAERHPLHEREVRVLGLTASPGADVDEAQVQQSIAELMHLMRSQIIAPQRERADLQRRVKKPKCVMQVYDLTDAERVLESDIETVLRRLERHLVDDPRLGAEFRARFSCVGLRLGSQEHLVACQDTLSRGQSNDEPDVIAVANVMHRLSLALLHLYDTGVETCLLTLFAGCIGHRTEACLSWAKWCFTELDVERTPRPERAAMVHELLGGYFGTWFYTVFSRHAEQLKAIVDAQWRRHEANKKRKQRAVDRKDFGVENSDTDFDSGSDDPENVPAVAPPSSKLRLLELVIGGLQNNDPNFRGIVFCETKRTAARVVKMLKKSRSCSHCAPAVFVGHSKSLIDEGEVLKMTHAQQQRCLAEFRSGKVRLLAATSVAEEGLDIAECSVVVRYDGSVNVRSFIQSRGRARRADSNYVAIMRRGPEANNFEGITRAVAMQDRVVDEFSAAPPPGVETSPTGDPASAARSPAPVWEVEPIMVLERLMKRYADDMRCEQYRERAKTGGMTVTFVCTLSMRVLDPQAGTGAIRVVRAAVGEASVARREAARSVCVELMRLDEQGRLKDAAQQAAKAPGIRTMIVLHRSDGEATAMVTGINPSDPANARHGKLPAGAEELISFQAEDWPRGLMPWEILMQFCRERKWALRDPKFNELDGDDGTVQWEAEVRVEAVGIDGERRWTTHKAEALDRSVALNSAAMAVLAKECTRPLIRIPVSEFEPRAAPPPIVC